MDNGNVYYFSPHISASYVLQYTQPWSNPGVTPGVTHKHGYCISTKNSVAQRCKWNDCAAEEQSYDIAQDCRITRSLN